MELNGKGSASELFQKLKKSFQDLQAQGKMNQVTNIEYDDASCKAIASGTGFKSLIECKDGKICVDLELNFLLRPMRGKIEETIQKMISKIL